MAFITIAIAATISVFLFIVVLPIILFKTTQKYDFSNNKKLNHLFFWLGFIITSIVFSVLFSLLFPSLQNMQDPEQAKEIIFSAQYFIYLTTSTIIHFGIQVVLLSLIFKEPYEKCVKATLRYYLVTFAASILILLVAVILGLVLAFSFSAS